MNIPEREILAMVAENDTDGDGVGDNSDYYPLDETRSEREYPVELMLLISILFGFVYISTRDNRHT